MKSYRFFDLTQAQNYATGSVILYDDVPYYVIGVEGGDSRNGFSMVLQELNYVQDSPENMWNNRITANSSSVRISYNIPDLGLLNYRINKNNTVISAARTPSRIFKIGLSVNSLFLFGWHKLSSSVRASNVITSTALRDCILNRYPLYSEALKTIKERKSEVAFSKRFAIGGEERYLFYKDEQVPVGKIEDDVPVLSEEFVYLKEMLQIDVNRG